MFLVYSKGSYTQEQMKTKIGDIFMRIRWLAGAFKRSRPVSFVWRSLVRGADALRYFFVHQVSVVGFLRLVGKMFGSGAQRRVLSMLKKVHSVEFRLRVKALSLSAVILLSIITQVPGIYKSTSALSRITSDIDRILSEPSSVYDSLLSRS